jgi:hypothetical protein
MCRARRSKLKGSRSCLSQVQEVNRCMALFLLRPSKVGSSTAQKPMAEQFDPNPKPRPLETKYQDKVFQGQHQAAL